MKIFSDVKLKLLCRTRRPPSSAAGPIHTSKTTFSARGCTSTDALQLKLNWWYLPSAKKIARRTVIREKVKLREGSQNGIRHSMRKTNLRQQVNSILTISGQWSFCKSILTWSEYVSHQTGRKKKGGCGPVRKEIKMNCRVERKVWIKK